MFVGPKGATPRQSNFNRAWSAALLRAAAKGTPPPEGLHFHDLRRTANEFAASSASVKELVARMGHSTARAALIHQRARRDANGRSRRLSPPRSRRRSTDARGAADLRLAILRLAPTDLVRTGRVAHLWPVPSLGATVRATARPVACTTDNKDSVAPCHPPCAVERLWGWPPPSWRWPRRKEL